MIARLQFTSARKESSRRQKKTALRAAQPQRCHWCICSRGNQLSRLVYVSRIARSRICIAIRASVSCNENFELTYQNNYKGMRTQTYQGD